MNIKDSKLGAKNKYYTFTYHSKLTLKFVVLLNDFIGSKTNKSKTSVSSLSDFCLVRYQYVPYYTFDVYLWEPFTLRIIDQ